MSDNTGFKHKWERQSIQDITNIKNGDTVMKTLQKKLGGTYREENGHLVPKLELPEQTHDQIGKYGQRRLDCIKSHRRGRYTAPQDLTAQMRNDLVDKIVIYAPDKSSGHRKQIVFSLSFVGS